MKKTIWVSFPSKRYPLYSRSHYAWDYLVKLNAQYKKKRRIFLITDQRFKRLYKTPLQTLQDNGITLLSFPAGELSKTHAVKLQLEEKLFKAQCTRNDTLITLGGGVVGDLGGFVAATYMRGLTYISIPTTLMAMVDSAIGGKTGIDTAFGKNLIGAFYHPEAIVVDTQFLKTLPQKEYLSGMAEVVKYAFIQNTTLYKLLTKHHTRLNKYPTNDPLADTLFTRLLRESILTKIRVVAHDEHETGYRRILNFGHTIAHAIELLCSYSFNHGLAVAIGMTFEAWLSYRMNILSHKDFQKVTTLIHHLGLPTTFPAQLTPTLSAQNLYRACQRDKKNNTATVRFTALKKIGAITPAKGAFVLPLEYPFFKKAFQEFMHLNH